MESNLPPPSTTNLLLLTYPQVSQKYAYLFQYILILILASPYFDGIHRGLTLVPAHVGYDGSGNATRFRAVFHWIRFDGIFDAVSGGFGVVGGYVDLVATVTEGFQPGNHGFRGLPGEVGRWRGRHASLG